MRWFEGNIAEAVAKSKSMNAIFTVFVEGTDDMSRELASTLETSDISTQLEDQSKFLPIKLSSTSDNYKHFSDIYKMVPVPSVFFIGRDGAPLEVVCGGITPDKLSHRIDKIVQVYYNTAEGQSVKASNLGASSSQAFLQAESQAASKPAQSVPDQAQSKQDQAQSKQDQAQSKPDQAQSKQDQAQSKQDQAQSKQDQAQTTSQAETPLQSASTVSQAQKDDGPTAAKQAKTEAEYEVVCDGGVCVRRPKNIDQTGSMGASTEQMVTEAPPPEQAPLDARVERAKELLEAKRREKEAKEKELEKQKELERRAMGQGVVELRKWQAEQELKDAAEERKRERLANEEARRKVLEQIEQDRAERRARHNPTSDASVAPPPAAVAPAPTPAVASGQVRIQLKMADGTSHATVFSAEDTLADIHSYIRDNKLVQNRAFTLWTMFPRRDLPSNSDTLASQGLAPSAALLVLNAGQTSGPDTPALPQPVARVYALVATLLHSLILQPLNGAWSWLSSRLFPTTTGRPAPAPPAPPAPPSRETAPSGLRQRTNVHRLREDHSSDDENNTWNGNSTQQM